MPLWCLRFSRWLICRLLIEFFQMPVIVSIVIETQIWFWQRKDDWMPLCILFIVSELKFIFSNRLKLQKGTQTVNFALFCHSMILIRIVGQPWKISVLTVLCVFFAPTPFISLCSFYDWYVMFHTVHLLVVIFSDGSVDRLRFWHDTIIVVIVGNFSDNCYWWLFSSLGLAACACLERSHYSRSSFKVWVDKWAISNIVQVRTQFVPDPAFPT